MDNTQFGRSGVWGGVDQGDGLSSMNPEDIESITVLKGAAAAALYGSRGGYGVINVVTKRGQARKGIGVEFTSNLVFENALNFSDLQQVYGPGHIIDRILVVPEFMQNLLLRKRHMAMVPVECGDQNLTALQLFSSTAFQDHILMPAITGNVFTKPEKHGRTVLLFQEEVKNRLSGFHSPI